MLSNVADLLDYCPSTGQLTWAHNSKKAGTPKKDSGYVRLKSKGKYYYAHRIIAYKLFGAFTGVVDHINRNVADNREVNLRIVTQQQNTQNQGVTKGSVSGISGVIWDKSRNRWVARIMVARKNKSLGRHTDFFEACCARKSAEARLNWLSNTQ